MAILWLCPSAERAPHVRSTCLFFLVAALVALGADAAELDVGRVSDTLK